MANPEHVEVVRQGAEAIRRWREENPGVRLDLREADLTGASWHGGFLGGRDLRGADLRGANLRGVILAMAKLAGANLQGARLDGTFLGEADLTEANLQEAYLRKANLQAAHLTGASLFRVRGAHQAYGLETVRFMPTDHTSAASNTADARNFERCRRPWPERWLDWERLRVVGRLPLFGLSYTALILIPIVFYGLAVYNQQIDQVHTWAEQIVAPPDSPLHQFASLLKRLDRRPIPSLSLVLLGSTVLLAVASTLYTAFCPSRIKEFSRDQWCDQIGRSLLHYWPLAWKYRYIRLACAACYALRGAGALWVLGTKVGHTALFIWWEHSTWPWPWR